MRIAASVLGVLLVASISASRWSRGSRPVLPAWLEAAGLFLAVSLCGWNLYRALAGDRRTSRDRAWDYLDQEEGPNAAESVDSEERGPLGSWLALAGYRSHAAVRWFIGLTVASTATGVALILLFRRSGIVEMGLRGLGSIPGAVGEIFWIPLVLGPWISLVVMAVLPWLVVRSTRRRIVTEVEQDLPLVLELLATLGESGLGFEAALARVIDAQPPERPLTVEFRTFQRETLTGRPRTEALRRLARRLDVTSLTIFVSAVVQAEQIGSGVSDVLRRQAEDVRDRRRDRALNLAQSLPIKLLFPLVICFLPAIFVVTLGPILLQFIKFADAIMSKRVPQ
jgi:tight adherence protein C